MYSVFTAFICLAVILISPRFFPRIPSPLIGLIVSTVIAAVFYPDKVATIASVYGAIPNTLPSFQMLDLSLERMIMLIEPALVIALLGAIESLLSAVVADEMANTRHNSNREWIGQGLANIVAPFFSGIPATGAIARTATNIKNGAASPLSGVIHGVVVLIILLLFAPYASAIPLASMAPILMVVAWNMSSKRTFMHILQTKSSDSLVLIVTFLLTVFIHLTVAVQVGLLLAIILFTKTMSESFDVKKVIPKQLIEAKLTDHISVFEMKGPLFFGTAQTFEDRLLTETEERADVLILNMSNVDYIDISGDAHFSKVVTRISKSGSLIIVGVPPQLEAMLLKTGLYERIGANHFFERLEDALDYAVETVEKRKKAQAARALG